MILLDLSDLKLKKYSQQLAYMTYDFSLDNDVDIKPIAKSEKLFEKWVANYPFYAKIVSYMLRYECSKNPFMIKKN